MRETTGAMDETDPANGVTEDWRGIVEVAGSAVFIFQGETLRYLNQAAVDLSGYDPAELLGRPFWTIVAPEDRARTKKRGLARQAGGKPPDRYEVRIVRKDGATRFVDFIGRVISWHGHPAVLGIARDVTDRVRAERQLAASLSEIESLHEISRATRGHLEPGPALRAALETLRNLLGAERAWLLHPADASSETYRIRYQACDPEFPGVSHPEKRLPYDEASRAMAAAVQATSEPVMHCPMPEEAYQTPRYAIRAQLVVGLRSGLADGPWALGLHRCRAAAPWTDRERRLFGLAAGLVEDRLARTELWRQLAARGQQLSRLLAATAGGIIGVDQEGRCTFANAAATRTLGYPSPESVVGRPLHPLIHHTCADGAPYPADRCPILAAARTGARAHVENEAFAHEDGTLIPVEYWAHPVQNDEEARGAVLAFWDMRDRLRTAEERARLRRKRDQRQRLESLGVLAGGVAHEFNNILQAIVGNVALVQKAFHVEALEHDCCEEVLRASRRAAGLCREMLAYSGKGRFVVERLDLSNAVRGLARLLESAVAPPAVLEVSLAPGLPPIEADRTQLQQVALNLASNAREACRADAGTVSIRTHEYTGPPSCPGIACFGRVRPDRRYVALEVKDDGEGLNATALERIFDPFFSTKESGRGLGLSAALGIVRAHDAVLCVDSSPGRGSTFRVLWPVAEVDVSAGSRVNTPEPARPFRGTVLLAEDEPSVRRSAERLLQAFGFAVLVADDGQIAIDLLAADPDRISVALLDVVMPRVGGEEAFWKLRAIRPDLPVVLMSGYTVSRVPETMRGMASFLQKPFTPETLAARLAEALGQSAPLHPLRGPRRLL